MPTNVKKTKADKRLANGERKGLGYQVDVPALYMGLSPAICTLETFVHAAGRPQFALKITCFELPDAPQFVPRVRAGRTAERLGCTDSPSLAFGTRWLEARSHLGLIVPSVVLQLERDLVLNPSHPVVADIRVREVFDFVYDERMFQVRGD
ncbi:RES family NAD+ phosphorylase [Pseudomonas sp. PKS]